MNHQNSLKSRPGNNKGIKYHRAMAIYTMLLLNLCYNCVVPNILQSSTQQLMVSFNRICEQELLLR